MKQRFFGDQMQAVKRGNRNASAGGMVNKTCSLCIGTVMFSDVSAAEVMQQVLNMN